MICIGLRIQGFRVWGGVEVCNLEVGFLEVHGKLSGVISLLKQVTTHEPPREALIIKMLEWGSI